MKLILTISILLNFAAQSQTVPLSQYRADSTMWQRMFSVQQRIINDLSARLSIEENKRIVVTGATVSNDSLFIPKPFDSSTTNYRLLALQAANDMTYKFYDTLTKGLRYIIDKNNFNTRLRIDTLKNVDLAQIIQAIKDINAGNVLTQGQVDILKNWMDKVKATF